MSSEDAIVKIQATITGYAGKPCSLLSIYYKELGVLVLAKIASFRQERYENSSVITNVPRIDRDALFEESDMKAAIVSFKNQKGRVAGNGTRGVVFEDGVGRADPESKIESDGIDVSGERFKISSDISNEQIAVLATCLFVDRLEQAQTNIDLIDGVSGVYERMLLGGSVITI